MGRPLTATPAAVQAAMIALRAAGIPVTVLNVRQRIGGGSLSTIARAVSDIRRRGSTAVMTVPAAGLHASAPSPGHPEPTGDLPVEATSLPSPATEPHGAQPPATQIAATGDQGLLILRLDQCEATIQQLETALGDGERGWHEARQECERLRSQNELLEHECSAGRLALERLQDELARMQELHRTRQRQWEDECNRIGQLVDENAAQRQAMAERDIAMHAQTDAFRACLAAYASAQERERASQAERVDALQRACAAAEAQASAVAADLAQRTRIAIEALGARDQLIAQQRLALADLTQRWAEGHPWNKPQDAPASGGDAPPEVG